MKAGNWIVVVILALSAVLFVSGVIKKIAYLRKATPRERKMYEEQDEERI